MEISCKNYKESVYRIIDELDLYWSQKSVFSNQWSEDRAKIYWWKECLEISPMTIIIEKPLDMFPIIPWRWNHFVMQLAELIWIYAWKNTLWDFFGQFASDTVKEFAQHTDVMYWWFWPRIRNEKLDQIKFAIDLLQKDNWTRSAMIWIYDPSLDSYDNWEHKPCATTVNFQIINWKVDCFLTLRANDLVKWYTAINYIEFAFLHSIVSYCLGMEIWRFVNYTNTMHYYTWKAKDRIENIKKFRELSKEDNDLNLKDFFDYSIAKENRYFKVLSDIDSIYKNLWTNNVWVPDIKMSNPIFSYIYKILWWIKSDKKISEIVEWLPNWLMFPLLESQYKTKRIDVEKIINIKNSETKAIISWRNSL